MTQSTIDISQLEQVVLQKLPTLIQKSPQIQELVLELARQNFADRQATEDKFYQLLNELRRDREEQAQKWDKQNRKWDEQHQKWEDAKLEFARMHEAIMAVAQKQERSIGALGARWGIQAESSFRNALAGILEKSY